MHNCLCMTKLCATDSLTPVYPVTRHTILPLTAEGLFDYGHFLMVWLLGNRSWDKTRSWESWEHSYRNLLPCHSIWAIIPCYLTLTQPPCFLPPIHPILTPPHSILVLYYTMLMLSTSPILSTTSELNPILFCAARIQLEAAAIM